MNKRLTKATTMTLTTTKDAGYEIRAIEENYTTQHVNIFNEGYNGTSSHTNLDINSINMTQQRGY